MGAPNEVANILSRALLLMNSNGKHWHQGHYVTEEPLDDGQYGYCSLGAIKQIAFDDPERPVWGKPDSAAMRAISTLFSVVRLDDEGGGYRSVHEWNDDPERNWEDIVEAFTEARERALEAG